MFKFQFIFLDTGEISDSEYKYKFPHTAMQGAMVFIGNALKFGARDPGDMVELRILKQDSAEPVIRMTRSLAEL